jgi:hypothetical protein
MKKIIMLMLLSLISIGFVFADSSSTLDVNSDACDDDDDNTYCTIQDAIDDASEGDTIEVAAGTYDESLEILTDNLILKSTDGAETTIINVSGAINAIKIGEYKKDGRHPTGVTIEGFTVKGWTERGIAQRNGNGTISVLNNIVIAPTSGSSVRGAIILSGGNGSLVKGNTVTIPDFGQKDWSSAGIMLMGTLNAIVEENFVTGLPALSDIGIAVVGAHNWASLDPNWVTASGNVIRNNTIKDTESGVDIAGDSQDTIVIGNNFIETNLSVHVYEGSYEAEPSGFTDISENKLGKLTNSIDNYIVNATHNYWGHATGPSGEGAGAGDTVSDNVDFSPWCTDADCTSISHIQVDDDGTNVFTRIQDAINAASDGDTIEVASGTYDETLDLGGKTLTIIGAGSDSTTINASEFTGYAISDFGDSTTIKDLKLIGSDHYGFKVSDVSDVTLENIKVDQSGKTGVDLNTVDGAILTNVEVTNTVGGFGIMILDSSNVDVTDIMTENNPWGGVSVHSVDADADTITFSGTFDAREDFALLLEQDPPYDGDFVNVEIPSKFNYAVYTIRNPKSTAYKQTFYFETKAEAIATADSFRDSDAYDYEDIALIDVQSGKYLVEDDFTIQDAINAASDGDTIEVASGTYAGAIVDKSVNIIGDSEEKPIINEGVNYKSSSSDYKSAFRPDVGNIEIKNFKIADTVALGIYAIGIDNVTVDSFRIEDTNQGITNWGGSEWEIKNNNILSTEATNGGGIGILVGIKSGQQANNNLIQNNEINSIATADSYSTPGISLSFDTRYGEYDKIDGTESLSGNIISDNIILASGDNKGGGIEVGTILGDTESDPDRDNPDKIRALMDAMALNDNIIERNNVDGLKTGVYLYIVNNLDLINNTIANSVTKGIIVGSDFSGININNNKIISNSQGVVNNVSGKTLDIEKNYWGAVNPDFDELVKGDVDYAPWYIDSKMTKLNEQVTSCSPGDEETDKSGTNIGECKFEIQERICQTDGTWGDWELTQSGVSPVAEICDNGLDDDCDGYTDSDDTDCSLSTDYFTSAQLESSSKGSDGASLIGYYSSWLTDTVKDALDWLYANKQDTLEGNEDIFSNWDKNASDDFDGKYDSLTGAPTTVSSFDNDVGYITGYTETDPFFRESVAFGIATDDITNWNTVFGWGNHADVGYASNEDLLSLETDLDSRVTDLEENATGQQDMLASLEQRAPKNSDGIDIYFTQGWNTFRLPWFIIAGTNQTVNGLALNEDYSVENVLEGIDFSYLAYQDSTGWKTYIPGDQEATDFTEFPYEAGSKDNVFHIYIDSDEGARLKIGLSKKEE